MIILRSYRRAGKTAQADLKVVCFWKTEKNGLGTAYVHGFRWALNNGYDFIFEMDADFLIIERKSFIMLVILAKQI
jgi:glycosyltransferase involved in cell wall biosynthesis